MTVISRSKSDELRLNYRGDRKYYHGPDIYDEVVRVLGEGVQEISLYFKQLIIDPVVLALTESPLDLPVYAKVVCTLDSEKKVFYLVSTQCASTVTRLEYDEEQVASQHVFVKEPFAISQPELSQPYSLMQRCVALNKILMKMTFPDVSGKWIYSRIDMQAPLQSGEITLKVVKKIGTSLVVSQVIVDGVEVGRIYFSLVKEVK